MSFLKRYSGAAYFFLFAAVFLTYAPILHDPLIRDDYWLLGQVKDIGILELWRLAYAQIIFFRPLGEFFYWLEWRFFGASVLFSHIFSLFLQGLDASLLFWFLGQLGMKKLSAYFAALLFALAPVDVEAVTWSAVRFDLAALFLMILSLGLYFIFLKRGGAVSYTGSLAAALAAMLTKEPAVMLVGLIPLMEIVYRKDPAVDTRAYDRAGFRRAAARRWLPLGGVFLVYMSGRLAVLHGMGGAAPVIGAPSARAAFFSAVAFIFPFSWLRVSPAVIPFTAALAAALILIMLLMVRVIRRPYLPANRRAAIFFGLFFVLSLAPIFPFVFIIGITQGLANSRYLFIPELAFVTMIVAALFDLGAGKRKLRHVLTFLLACIMLFDVVAIQKNNQPWQAADAVSGSILSQTKKLVPDPAPGAVFFYRDMPVMSGYSVFDQVTLPPAIAITYRRTDIRAFVAGDSINQDLLRKAYQFGYDRKKGVLRLLANPGS